MMDMADVAVPPVPGCSQRRWRDEPAARHDPVRAQRPPPVRRQRPVPRGRSRWPSCRKPAASGAWKKPCKKLRPDNLFRKVWRWLRDRRRYTGNREAKFFFGDGEPRLDRPELVREVPHINHPDVVETGARTQARPDLRVRHLADPRRTAEGGRLGIVNLHGGLSPEYRGADCTFWALYNGEPEKVGCTLHYIDAGIDTGRLIAHVSPEVRAGDERTDAVLACGAGQRRGLRRSRCTAGDGRALGMAQPGKGRLYQVKDRGLRHERALAERLASGMLAGMALPRRVRWFTPEAALERNP